MDIKKLKAMQSELDMQARKEIYEDLPEMAINFITDKVVEYSLNNVKMRNHSSTSARNINNWIEQGILKVEQNDKGKINRFTREECIWLNLVTELRGFGVSLEKIKSIRYELFNELFPSFSIFRFAIIRTILDNDQTLILFSDGVIKLMSSNLYSKWIKKRILPPHIHISFIGLLDDVFTENSFDLKIENIDVYDNVNILKIMYFLKTGDYESIKLEIKKGDIRLIENSKQLIKNPELIDLIIFGKYDKIEIASNGEIFVI